MARSILDRLLARLVYVDGCLIFRGFLRNGYGRLWDARKGGPVQAHRVAFELFRGPIPEGLELDHLCRVRACVNPYHLEPVTLQDNVLRGEGPTARNARQTECDAGRPLILEGGLSWQQMGFSPVDMDWSEAKAAAARDAVNALGYPPMLLGIPGDNTCSNQAACEPAPTPSTWSP